MRIAALPAPQLYQCFRPKFVVGLCVFDGGTFAVQQFTPQTPVYLLANGALNAGVAVALAVSLVEILRLWQGFSPSVEAAVDVNTEPEAKTQLLLQPIADGLV